MSEEKKEPNQYWLADDKDFYGSPCLIAHYSSEDAGPGSIHVVEKSYTDALKATLDKRELALAGYTQMETDLRTEIELLHKENERLKETISYLPKVPTQPYEKELAQEVERLKSELERAKGEIERFKNALE